LNQEGNNVTNDEDSSKASDWDPVDVCYSRRQNSETEPGDQEVASSTDKEGCKDNER
jgi:hypothetical protein